MQNKLLSANNKNDKNLFFNIFLLYNRIMEEKKVIWITGASSGIGRALAIKVCKEGWIVAASARRENLLHDLNK